MFTIKNILILIGRNVIISLVAVSISTVAIVFLSNKIENLSDSVALNHRLEAQLKKTNELSDTLKNDVQTIGTNNVDIENAFVSSDNILGFINTLDNLASQKSIMETYHFGTPAPSVISAPFPISTIEYSNSLETSLLNFSDYLKAFEKMPYFTKIDGFTISSQDPLGWLGMSTISFNATLYTKTAQ